MRFTVGFRLYSLVVFLLALLVLTGYLGLNISAQAISGLDTVYKDRVIPLEDLKIIADSYAVSIVDVSHKIRNGNMIRADGEKEIIRAQEIIKQKWGAYLATELVEEEIVLIGQIRPLIEKADESVARLLNILKSGDQKRFEQFVIDELYPAIDPVSEKFSQLVGVQLSVAKSEYEKNSSLYYTTRSRMLLVILFGVIVASIVAARIIRNLLRQIGSEPEELAEIALKVADGDLDLTIPAAVPGSVMAAIGNMVRQLHEKASLAAKIADGDISLTLIPSSPKDILGNALRKMTDNLNKILEQIQLAVEQISSGSGEVASTSQSLAQGATEQASAIEEISASLNIMSEKIRSSSENAGQANILAGSTKKSAEAGLCQMTEMLAAMREINESSQKVVKIVKNIDDIAFQTNLLALNAAVEAARAGQHGKGFTVVAEEVRNLAARSARAARETAELIESSAQRIDKGAAISEKTNLALNEIVSGIGKVSDWLSEIALSASEQSDGIEEIKSGLFQIEKVTQQNTANAEEGAAAAQELSGQSAHLFELAKYFRLRKAQGLNLISG